MSVKESEEKCFTILWKLENMSYCLQKQRDEIESPVFMLDEIDSTKWKLSLYPRGLAYKDYICYCLNRVLDDKSTKDVKINFELAFIGKDSSVLKSTVLKEQVFPYYGLSGYGANEFMNQEDVFVSRISVFLPKDTLTARCRIWKVDGAMTKNVRCTAHTRIEVEKGSFLWNVKNFSALESEKKHNYQIKSIKNNTPLMSVDLSLTRELNSADVIRFKLSLQDHSVKFSNLKLFLVTDSGIRLECNQEEIWFDNPALSKSFTFTYTKKKLLEGRSVYLPKDTLSVLWEWVFNRGVISNKFQENQYGCMNYESNISNNDGFRNDDTNIVNSLMDRMKSLYDEQFLSDVKLKTNTGVFPAHKLILSAHSSVFKTMFSSDMKEKHGNCVNIEDLSDDTVTRMLYFIYTTRVEDLTWESASRLYTAADKYAILSLKNICSSFLKQNLSPSNACEILLLADLHHDSDLKSHVQDYILKNGKQITNSEEWNILIQANSKLAAETLCLVFK